MGGGTQITACGLRDTKCKESVVRHGRKTSYLYCWAHAAPTPLVAPKVVNHCSRSLSSTPSKGKIGKATELRNYCCTNLFFCTNDSSTSFGPNNSSTSFWPKQTDSTSFGQIISGRLSVGSSTEGLPYPIPSAHLNLRFTAEPFVVHDYSLGYML